MRKWNRDGVFFDVTSPDVNFSSVAEPDVKGLEVVEEMSKMDSGTLYMLDRNHFYSRVLRPGVRLRVSWGLRHLDGTEQIRHPIDVIIQSPSGGGDGGGEISYNCSFTALDVRGTQGVRHYESGTRGDVIADAFDRLGIRADSRVIQFSHMNEPINSGTKITQFESTFRFLVRMADENRAGFKIGMDESGKLFGCFVNFDLVGTISRAVCGTSALDLDYGTPEANVKSYTWHDNSLDASIGQGFRMVLIDGQYQILRTIVENETVKTWRLVPERIESSLRGAGDYSAMTTLLSEYLSAKEFAEVERFFVLDTVTTAPQGSGIEVNVEMLGEPYVTAGMVASFGVGFPDKIGADDRTWWVQRSTHKIGGDGYDLSLVIKDAYSFSETGVKLAPVGGTS